jgi:hypothetical protein
MGKGKQPLKKTAMSAHELLDGLSAEAAFSEPHQQGRRLLLKFIGGDHPELDRIEFQWSSESEAAHWQQGDAKNQLSWTKIPQALSLVFLDYLAATGGKIPGPVVFTGARNGSLAASLGDAISDRNSRLHILFMERRHHAPPGSRVKHVFGGKNHHGKEDGERRIFVRSEHLPADCIDLYWTAQGLDRITNPEVFRVLAERIRKSLGIEVPPPLVLPVGKGSSLEPPPTEKPTPSPKPAEGTLAAKPQAHPTTEREPIHETPPAEATKAKASITDKPPAKPVSQPEAPKKTLPRAKAEAGPEPDKRRERSPDKKPRSSEALRAATQPRLPPIDPELFAIQNPGGLAWSDSMGLLDFGAGESGEDIWQVKDACEGVLILGAPGSGKTSGSGFAFASAFLTAGFGGLVLAAKPDEAKRWQNLCARYGRAGDCVVVTSGGPHKLNVLAYETQRPGDRLAMTDDLIAFFRVLIAIVSKRTSTQGKDDFWTNATNQLMRELFDVFLLAREPMTIDSLARFVTKAPEEPTENWRGIPFFGSVLERAEAGVKSQEDERVFRCSLEYWTETYPGIAPVTRSGIVLGFTAMANALSGRGIHELISSETTLTPEMILSGKIVILDLPIKDCGQGGLLIQAAWKYLFQRAVERRADKGKETARPVFLWEDEGHMFFSQHDIDFQPTARDCRAAHVILSQSLHNFYQLGHNQHAVQGVFATMNTQIFHANGDLETNKWASEKMGTTMKTLVNVSISSQPKRPTQPKHWLFDAFKQDNERESTSSTSINQHREKVFQPESFSQLKKGGDGTCHAVVLWVSHQFKANKGRPFCVKVFGQDNKQ